MLRLLEDDRVVYAISDRSSELQEDLRAVEEWEATWYTNSNTFKCEHVKFKGKYQQGITNDYMLHNTVIPKESKAKYLELKLVILRYSME